MSRGKSLPFRLSRSLSSPPIWSQNRWSMMRFCAAFGIRSGWSVPVPMSISRSSDAAVNSGISSSTPSSSNGSLLSSTTRKLYPKPAIPAICWIH
ncbi:MAG: autoinducer binding domain-containing protein [Planctomycetaceae bacterium]|nr:autoinducer binding domain-containing protein [Planctomycetaceae bacterium]